MLRLSLRPNLIAAYLAAVMVCAMGWVAYRSLDRAVYTSGTSRSALAVMTAVRSLDDAMRDADVAEQQLVTTGSPQDGGAYAAATDRTVRALASLRTVATPYDMVSARVDSLGYFVHLRLAELDELVHAGRDAARSKPDTVAVKRSGEADTRIGELLDSIGATMERSGSGSVAGAGADRSVLLLIVLLAGAAALLLALFVHATHWRNVRAHRRMVDDLDSQAVQLQLQTNELAATNRDLERATAEMLRQTLEAERSGTRLAGILGSATDAVVSFDDDERIAYFNAAAERLFGRDDAALPAAPILSMVSDRVVTAFEEHMLAARRSAHLGAPNPEVWDTLVVRADDSEVPVEVSMAYTRTGKHGLFTAVLRDVTLQRQLEEEFRQAQKMEAVGRLAGGIAHDFNNLLTVIGASSDFLLHDLPSGAESLAADVREIKAATNRAATLTRQLLAFSRRQLVQPQMLDLNAVVRDMETMLRRLIGEDTVLLTEYVADVGLITIDRGQLEQVVVNLVVNARDAMPEGGTIRLRTAADRLTRKAMRSTGGNTGECISLSVADAGVGMDETTRSRIFEPFFTTKPQGKGTGLGLSTVYGIVKANGGDIVVESAAGRGTTFRLQFPRADEAEAEAAIAAESPPIAANGGYETVLVVEDEEPLRRLTRRILESRGYTVIDAADGHEAIKALASAITPVHLLLTDVVMPRMSGRELVERVLPVYPSLRVLFMSGYTEDTILQHRVARLGLRVLEKPFTRDDLSLAVRDTLDRAAEPVATG